MIEKIMERKIKKLQGSVLGIGIQDENMLKAIDKNKKIVFCDLLLSKDIDDNDEEGSSTRFKQIKFKKLKKYYKKNKIDTTIVNFESILPYHRSFIKNSVYITNKNIWLYSKEESEFLSIYIKRFERYNIELKKENKQNEVLYILNLENKKNYRFKMFYYIYDLLYDIANFISDLLIN